jgi:hypothetical protein
MGEHCITITLLLPGHAETQSNGLPSSSPSWVPASGLEEVRATGDEGAGLRASDARKGFPEDMLVVMDNALLYVQGGAREERCV